MWYAMLAGAAYSCAYTLDSSKLGFWLAILISTTLVSYLRWKP